MTNVEHALKPFMARLRLRRAAKWAGYGLLCGAASALLIRLASYLWAFPTALWWCLAAFAAAPVLFALVAWLAPIDPMHVARRIDEQGLKARTQTALMLSDSDTPMAVVQRDDTLACLESADPGELLPVKAPLVALLCAAGCMLLFGASFLIANPQTELLKVRADYRAEMTKQAELVDEGAAKLDADDPQTPELRKLLGDLSLALRQSDDLKTALGALDNAEKGVEKLQTSLSKVAKTALQTAGQSELVKALESDDLEAAKAALEELKNSDNASALSEAAQSAAGTAAQAALSQAAQALASGNLSQAIQSLQAALSGQSSATAQTLALSAMARMAATQACSSSALMAGGSGNMSIAAFGSAQGSGSGNAAGAGAGGGAGLGSSNKDGGYGGMQQQAVASGTSDPQKKVANYEPIYDPTRLDANGEQVNERGIMGQGEVSEAEAGLGVGSLDGQVPYNEVLGEYQQQALEASQFAELPAYAQSWVEQYFSMLE